MNNTLHGQEVRPFQRALVLTCGALATEVGHHFSQQLVKATSPQEGIAVKQITTLEEAASVRAALREISQVTNKAVLAKRGWQMDRLDELALYLIVDLDDPAVNMDFPSLVTAVGDIARQELGVSVATLCLALAPTASEDDDPKLAQIAGGHELFARGVFVLGMTNGLGLCLPDAAMLARQAAAILYALATTTLRDAPEWLADQRDASVNGGPPVSSVGMTVWPWSQTAELDQLERQWLALVLKAWLANDPAEETVAIGERWLLAAALEPDQLARRLSNGAERRLLMPAPAVPQPWRLPAVYLPLCTLSAELPWAVTEALDTRTKTAAQTIGVDMQTLVKELLREMPAGGLARVRALLGHLEARLDEKQELVGAQIEQLAERRQAVATRHNLLANELKQAVAQWPPSTVRGWLHVWLRPWHWFHLGWLYHQMNQLARQLTQLENEWRQWQWQYLTATQIEFVYQQLANRVRQLDGQAEEVVDMLRYMQAHVTNGPPDEADYLGQRLAQLVDGPELEAIWAAQAIGGLEGQLTALDDSVVSDLAAKGRRRLATKGDFSTVNALRWRYPTTEAIKNWWRESWEGAAPLWRHCERQPGDTGQNELSGLTLVYGADALRLQETLPWLDAPNIRWLVGPDSDLVIMRTKEIWRQGD